MSAKFIGNIYPKIFLEAVVHKCFPIKLFLKISQYSQENTFAGVSYEYCEIFKNSFFYRTPRVAVYVGNSVSVDKEPVNTVDTAKRR